MQETDMSRKTLEREAHELIDFTSTCTGADGLLSQWVDPITGKRDTIPLLSDFGDWAPFFLAFDRPDLVRKHLDALPSYLERGLLRPTKRRFGIPYLTAFEHTDLILGLLDCADYGLDDAKDAAHMMLDACMRTFRLDSSGVRSYYVPSIRFAAPISSTVDGTYIELLVQASRTFHEPAYASQAVALADYFIGLPFVKEHYLLPELSGQVWGKRTRRSQVMKHNTNTLYGLLELHRHRPQTRLTRVIEKWIESVPYFLSDSGYAFFSVVRKNDSWTGDHIDIVPNVGLLDLLCDLAHYLPNEQARTLAISLGEKLLLLQIAETGLVKRSPDCQETHLDAQTDLVVAWEKLSELTGDARFHEAAVRLFGAIRRFHRFKGGYVKSCDSRTGEIINHLFETRYNSLLLKPYLLYASGSPIFSNDKLVQLLKDR